MKSFKYLIYVLAAIAIPLWIALTNFGSKPDSKTTFALDSASIQQLSKIAIAQPPTSSSPTQVNINGTHLDSLFMFLAKSNVQNNSQRDKGNEQLQTSIKALTDISISNSQTLQSLLSKDRNVRVSVDPITLNPPTSSNTPSNPYQSSLDNIYDLKENGPFPLWKINSNVMTQEVLIILNNSSRSYPAIIDKIEPMFNDTKFDSVSIKDLPSIEPLNQAVIKYPGYKYEGKFYIIGKFIKTKKRLFGKVDTTYTNFKIPVSLLR